MSEESETKNKKEIGDDLVVRDQEKTIRNVLVVAAIATVLGLFGTGFGVYSTIQVNRVLGSFEKNDLVLEGANGVDSEDAEDDEHAEIEEDDDFRYGLPASADSIDYISLMYDNGNNYLEVYRDDSAIEYSTLGDNDEYQTNTVNGDIDRIFKFIYDNDLDKIKADEVGDEDETWYLEVSSSEGYSYAGGQGALPEWIEALRQEIKASEKQ